MAAITLTIHSQDHLFKTRNAKSIEFADFAHAVLTVNILNTSAVAHGYTYWIDSDELDALIKAEAKQGAQS